MPPLFAHRKMLTLSQKIYPISPAVQGLASQDRYKLICAHEAPFTVIISALNGTLQK